MITLIATHKFHIEHKWAVPTVKQPSCILSVVFMNNIMMNAHKRAPLNTESILY